MPTGKTLETVKERGSLYASYCERQSKRFNFSAFVFNRVQLIHSPLTEFGAAAIKQFRVSARRAAISCSEPVPNFTRTTCRAARNC